ncbi:unnamed protein product [Alopecurus aequalis]
MPRHRRRCCGLRRILSFAGGAGALLLLSGGGTALSSLGSLSSPGSSLSSPGSSLSSPGSSLSSPGLLSSPGSSLSSPGSLSVGTWLQQPHFFPPPELLLPPPPELLLSEGPARQESEADISFARRLLPVRRHAHDQSPPPEQEDDVVLLPDQEVLVLADEPAVGSAMCVFQGGASSPARSLGRLPGPGHHAYICLMPDSGQPLQAPRLLHSAPAPAPTPHLLARLLPSWASPAPAAADHNSLLSWSDNRLVFDSALLDGGDLLVFAKARRHGLVTNAAPADVHCMYSNGSMTASFPAITSSQQVIRCPPPPMPLSYGRVTLVVNGEMPMLSLATYSPHQSGVSVTARKNNSICACTMVRDVAKFLSEWVQHHAAIGVDQFYLYDNSSQDDLADQVDHLNAAGFKVFTVAWPWTKTQEAGLSHCAAVHQNSCQWMAYIDIDEFIFSPDWNRFDHPSKSMLESVVASFGPQVGQIHLLCYDFGPSGQTAHPRDGVCQGYTCRTEKPQRYKSLVRLDAVDDSLKNSIHHFELKSGFSSNWTFLARVNHYKFQAWSEFKQKFKRRVSAYVPDWKDPVKLQSGDRAPGLGVEAVEPPGWANRFCEWKDTAMKELSIKWFGVGLGGR